MEHLDPRCFFAFDWCNGIAEIIPCARVSAGRSSSSSSSSSVIARAQKCLRVFCVLPAHGCIKGAVAASASNSQISKAIYFEARRLPVHRRRRVRSCDGGSSRRCLTGRGSCVNAVVKVANLVVEDGVVERFNSRAATFPRNQVPAHAAEQRALLRAHSKLVDDVVKRGGGLGTSTLGSAKDVQVHALVVGCSGRQDWHTNPLQLAVIQAASFEQV